MDAIVSLPDTRLSIISFFRSLGKLSNAITPRNNTATVSSIFVHLGDALETIGNLFYFHRKMTMYDALTSAATGVRVGGPKKILQKMQIQQKAKR